MARKFLLISLLFFLSSNLLAQSDNFLVGKVFDAVTKEPLPFATIVLKKNCLGVFSNADGSFKISNNPDFQTDSLIITFIGYQRTAIAIRSMEENSIRKIYLKPSTIQLAEIEIVARHKKLNSKTIVRRAIRNIRKNYPVKPYNYISYYRDYQKKEGTYLNMNEAIVQTLEEGVNKSSAMNKFRLLDFRQNKEFQRLDISPYYDTIPSPDFDNPNKFIKFGNLPDQGGNELKILLIHDPIRNFEAETFSFIHTFRTDFIRNHLLSEWIPVYDNNILLYKIDFKPQHLFTGDSLLVTGEIMIHPKDYAIYRLKYSGTYLLKDGSNKKMFDIIIEYGREKAVNALMGLKYISFNNIFNVVDKADTTFFKLVGACVQPGDLSNSNIILEFNHIPDIASASNKDCYEIFSDLNKAKISKITVKDNQVLIKIIPMASNLKTLPKIDISVKGIRDINGRILNVKKNLEFYQYRELFVQEFNKPITFRESYFLQNAPLIENQTSRYLGDQKYWMNTPIQQP